MKTSKILLAAAMTAFATAAAADYDGSAAAYFAYKPTATPAAKASATAIPQTGAVSENGLFVYSGSDRGWIPASHSYVFVGKTLAHAPDCLPYNAPNAVKGPVNPTASHG